MRRYATIRFHLRGRRRGRSTVTVVPSFHTDSTRTAPPRALTHGALHDRKAQPRPATMGQARSRVHLVVPLEDAMLLLQIGMPTPRSITRVQIALSSAVGWAYDPDRGALVGELGGVVDRFRTSVRASGRSGAADAGIDLEREGEVLGAAGRSPSQRGVDFPGLDPLPGARGLR